MANIVVDNTNDVLIDNPFGVGTPINGVVLFNYLTREGLVALPVDVILQPSAGDNTKLVLKSGIFKNTGTFTAIFKSGDGTQTVQTPISVTNVVTQNSNNSSCDPCCKSTCGSSSNNQTILKEVTNIVKENSIYQEEKWNCLSSEWRSFLDTYNQDFLKYIGELDLTKKDFDLAKKEFENELGKLNNFESDVKDKLNSFKSLLDTNDITVGNLQKIISDLNLKYSHFGNLKEDFDKFQREINKIATFEMNLESLDNKVGNVENLRQAFESIKFSIDLKDQNEEKREQSRIAQIQEFRKSLQDNKNLIQDAILKLTQRDLDIDKIAVIEENLKVNNEKQEDILKEFTINKTLVESLKCKYDNVLEKINAFIEELAKVETTLNEFDTRIKTIEKEFCSINSSIASLNTFMNEIKPKFEILQASGFLDLTQAQLTKLVNFAKS